MRVVWTHAAVRAAWYAYDYLYDFNPQAAELLAGSLIATAGGLARFPRRGRKLPGTGFREVTPMHPYLLRYRLTADEVIILRVRRLSQRHWS